MSDNENQYFAVRESEDTASTLLDKGTTFFSRIEANDYLNKLRRMWYFYHGIFGAKEHEVSFTGEQGELVNLPVNHFRNLATYMLNMITANRPIMEARAINTDYKSLSQTYLANGILDYYMREKGLETVIKRAAEMAIVLGAGFVKLEWNATSGEAYDVDPDTGEFNYTGELEFANLSPLDVVVDGSKETWDNEWVLTRSFVNKYNLIAKYPEYAKKIESLQTKNSSNTYRLSVFSNDDTDDIPVYEFFHKKTEAVEEGRYMLFLSSDIVLLDTKIPYREIPVFRISAGDIIGTPYGYSPMFDVYPIQEAINSLYGSILTNQQAFAVQNIWIKTGSNIDVASIEGGMNFIESQFKPEPLNLTSTDASTFKFLAELIQSAETISGINSVTRGNPEASLESGSALALVQSMALQFISGLQGSYVKLIEDIGTSVIEILKDYAHTPRLVALVGKNKRTYLKEFKGDDLSEIKRVVVDVGNPLSRTIAGRVEMAQQLAQMKLLKSPEQYFQVMNTGRLDSIYEGEMSELLLIKSENEKLMVGDKVYSSPLDQHRLHIVEHRAVIADPDLRNNPELLKITQDHIQEHINALRTVDPDLLQLIGEQPLNPVGSTSDQLPPGPMNPNGGQPMNNQKILQESNMQDINLSKDVMSPVQSPKKPELPTPPAPFQNSPVLPEDLI